MSAPTCPTCSSPMKQRAGSRGAFWGCVKYPECRGTRPVTESPTSPTPTPKVTPAQAAMAPGPTADLTHELQRVGGYLGIAIDTLRKVAAQLDAAIAKNDEADF